MNFPEQCITLKVRFPGWTPLLGVGVSGEGASGVSFNAVVRDDFRVLKGHGFSRAVNCFFYVALATEGLRY